MEAKENLEWAADRQENKEQINNRNLIPEHRTRHIIPKTEIDESDTDNALRMSQSMTRINELTQLASSNTRPQSTRQKSALFRERLASNSTLREDDTSKLEIKSADLKILRERTFEETDRLAEHPDTSLTEQNQNDNTNIRDIYERMFKRHIRKQKQITKSKYSESIDENDSNQPGIVNEPDHAIETQYNQCQTENSVTCEIPKIYQITLEILEKSHNIDAKQPYKLPDTRSETNDNTSDSGYNEGHPMPKHYTADTVTIEEEKNSQTVSHERSILVNLNISDRLEENEPDDEIDEENEFDDVDLSLTSEDALLISEIVQSTNVNHINKNSNKNKYVLHNTDDNVDRTMDNDELNSTSEISIVSNNLRGHSRLSNITEITVHTDINHVLDDHSKLNRTRSFSAPDFRTFLKDDKTRESSTAENKTEYSNIAKEPNTRITGFCDKSVQASDNDFMKFVKFPHLDDSTRIIRGQTRNKTRSNETKQEHDERFQKKQIAHDRKVKRGTKKFNIVNEDGSILPISIRKKPRRPKKSEDTEIYKFAPSPATMMEIQQLMTDPTKRNVPKQEPPQSYVYSEESEDEAKEDLDIGHYSYIHACEQLENPPIRKIFEQLQTTEISLQYFGLNSNDVIALAYALLHNHRVESVDLEDNRLQEDGILHVIELLNYNNIISSLSLANNKLTVTCAGMLKEALIKNTWLTHLNLSGTKFGDDGAKHLGLALRSNVSIIWMNLSHNDIGVTGAQHIGRALSINDTLEVLDLSWNHIRRMGALAICKGLQENSSIVNFNLSWNGFGLEGSLALENVFKENMSLKCIDLSNNRINWDGSVYLARGLKKNNMLRILKLGDNPLPLDGILKLLNAVSSHKSNLTHLSLENVPVNSKIMEVVNNISRQRLFTITHGGVLDSSDMFGIKRGRERREDPFTLLIRYISMMGIRVLDLFRIFESGANSIVTKENFIRGVKKVGAPLSDREIELVARRLERKGGAISYSILANGVRNHMREEKKEDKRQEHIEVKKQEHRKNFLKSDLGEVKAPEIKELSLFKLAAGKNFARIMSSSNMLGSSRKGSPTPESSRVSLLPKLIDKTSTTEKSKAMSLDAYRAESAKRRRQRRLFSIM